jgi:hypothetical protein
MMGLTFVARNHLVARARIARLSRRTTVAAEALERRVLLASFRGVSLQDEFDLLGGGPTTSPCPDTMGAIGPNHFLEEIKGAVAVFDKASGARLSITTLANFFTVTIDGTTYPRTAISDPHCIYDARSGHWFAVALELGATGNDDNGVMLAVSRTSDPTQTWDKYFMDVGFAGLFTDYDTLGLDDNGLYLGANMFPGGDKGKAPGRGAVTAQIIATPKAPLIGGTPSLGPLFQFTGIGEMNAPQPAFNFDTVGSSDRAWFVSSSNTANSNVNYRTLTWSGGVPTLSSPGVLTTPTYGFPINAPAMGSTTPLNVVDDRLNMAVIRNGHLWTVRNVGVNATGGATGSNRTAVEWLDLNVTAASPTLSQSGRIFDTAATNPRYYYVPSLNVNAKGDVRIGFSGSKSTEFVGAYFSGRAPGDAAGATTAPQLIKAGEAAYQRLDGTGRNRWGDFSYTSIDPTNDLTIWTIQEYASTGPANNIWGTWIHSITPNGIWDAGGDGANWTDALNWSNDVVPGPNDAVIINLPGTFTVNLPSVAATQVFSLTLGNATNSSPTLSLPTNGNRVLKVGALTVNGASKLDLNDNDLIVDYSGTSPRGGIQTFINTARANGAWTGSGITSTSARNNAQHNTTLGALEATEYKSLYGQSATFDGQVIDNSAILVKYTYYGDTDFNGRVNFDDYVRTDNGFNNHLTGWLNGDFDGNGLVNFDDYVLLDLAFNTQTAVL